MDSTNWLDYIVPDLDQCSTRVIIFRGYSRGITVHARHVISIPIASGGSEVYTSQSEDCVVIHIGYISIVVLWCTVCPDFGYSVHQSTTIDMYPIWMTTQSLDWEVYTSDPLEAVGIEITCLSCTLVPLLYPLKNVTLVLQRPRSGTM